MAAEWEWPTERDKESNPRIQWARWAERYTTYRLLGPKRSLLAVYNAERALAHKKPSRGVPGSWDDLARAHRWRERVAAWDAAEQERDRREREAAERKLREQARQNRRRLLEFGYSMLMKAMSNVVEGIDDQNAQRFMTAIEKYNREMRLEYGDGPTERLEHTGKDGGPIQTSSVQVYIPDNQRAPVRDDGDEDPDDDLI